ncbi:hypothetical protein F183_A12670 [Bryobacterales bacterium F-183]|nr:hypothetical protein F183_A12670 [Bryobacterales bacterium F-183]
MFTIQRVAIVLLVAAPVAFPQGSCSVTQAIRVATFDTNVSKDETNVPQRVAALANILPQAAQLQNLAVMCVNDLRRPEVRNAALANFDRNIWNIYHPTPVNQSGCKNACVVNTTYSALGFTLPLNKWMEYCSFTPVPGKGTSCSQATTESEFRACLAGFCPFMPSFMTANSPTCDYCVSAPVTGESRTTRLFKCTATFTDADAVNCRYGEGGEAGGTLISRYPFLATEYRQFAPPPQVPAAPGYSPFPPGLSNWGLTYGLVSTPIGRVHLFCSAQTTPWTAMADPPWNLNDTYAQPLNAAQNQEILNYIQSKANGEPVIFMGNTGSGPAVGSSPTGPANAIWASNFATLQTSLTDALLANRNASTSQPAPAAACTYNCSSPNQAAYTDHILTSGQATVPQGYDPALCHTNGTTMFTADLATTPNGLVPVSKHFGVRSDISVSSKATQTTANDVNLTFSPSSSTVSLSARVTVNGAAVDSGSVIFNANPLFSGLNAPIGANGIATATMQLPAGTAAGVYPLTAIYTPAVPYLASSSDTTRRISIARANPVITWNQPASIAFGSALSSTQLNATANVAGTFSYTPPIGTVLPVGANQPLSVSFTPTSTNYATVTASTTITVTAGNSGTPANIITQRTLSRDANNNVVVTLTLANIGGTTANNASVRTLRIGTLSASLLPRGFGNIAANATASAVFVIPNSSSLATGTANTLTVAGTYTGATFSSSSRVTIP